MKKLSFFSGLIIAGLFINSYNNALLKMNPQNAELPKMDLPITENLTREAFWNVYKPGCDEHLILHKIRNSKCYIPELDLVAVFEKEIIGHIISMHFGAGFNTVRQPE